MPTPFELFLGRLKAILCRGRGADGSLGAEAQARAIAAGRLRYSAVPLSDIPVSGNALDRALYIRGWNLDRGGAGPNVGFVDKREQLVNIETCVGYLQSPPLVNLVHLAAGETAAWNVTEPGIRAAEDARRIELALCFPVLLQGNLGEHDARIINITPQGPTRDERLGGGRIVRVQAWSLHTWFENTQ